MRKLVLAAILSTFMLSGRVWALGLGQIELLSALNQPLNAEIELLSVRPGETEGMIVTLASEEAFQRAGIDRPFFLNQLEFEVKQRDGDAAYIHVTTRQPMVEPFLSFLVAVDWPRGRLLREYTLLVDPPVFATQQPTTTAVTPIPEASTEPATAVGVPAPIERSDEVQVMPEPVEGSSTAGSSAEQLPSPEAPLSGELVDTAPLETQSLPAGTASESTAANAGSTLPQQPADNGFGAPSYDAGSDGELFPRLDIADTQSSAPTAQDSGKTEQSAAATAGSAQDTGWKVKRNETLWQISRSLKPTGVSTQQMMIALLRENPEAFFNGNINRLKTGVVLRTPAADSVRAISLADAGAVVAEQNALWQEYRAARGSTAAASTEPSDLDTSQDNSSGRLALVAPDSGSTSASGQAGSSSADAQVGALTKDLALTREELEAERLRNQELQTRLADLEEAVSNMDQLISIRDTQLAELKAQLENIESSSQQREQAAEQAVADAEAAAEAAQVEAAAAAQRAQQAEAQQQAANSTTQAAGEQVATQVQVMPEPADSTVENNLENSADVTDASQATASSDVTSPSLENSDEQQADSTSEADAVATDASTANEASTTPTTNPDTEVSSAQSDQVQPAVEPDPQPTNAEMSFVERMMSIAAGLLGGFAGLIGLLGNPLLLAAVGGVAVLLVALLYWRRRSRLSEDAEVLDIQPVMDEMPPLTTGEQPVVDMADSTTGSFSVEDDSLDTGELSAAAFDAALQTDTQEVVDDAADDVMAEADVYLAYGLFQQAEDLLKPAVQENPDRFDYHEKLVETYFASKNKDAFLETARGFRAALGDRPDPLWDRVVAMGKELAPGEALFEAATTTGDVSVTDFRPVKPEHADIDLGSSIGDAQPDLDFGAETPAAQPEVDFDTGTQHAIPDELFADTDLDASATEPGELDVMSATVEETGLEFDISELSGLDDTVEEIGQALVTDQTIAVLDDTGEINTGQFESITGETESITDEFEIVGPVDAVDITSPDATDITAPDVLDSLGHQLSNPDTSASFDMGNTDEIPNIGDGEQFDLDDMDTQVVSSGDTQEAPALVSELMPSVTDEMLSARVAEMTDGESGVQPVVASPPGDEVDTMLDLAKAYIDMGDNESAGSALQEVMSSGNADQRSEAEGLLAKIS